MIGEVIYVACLITVILLFVIGWLVVMNLSLRTSQNNKLKYDPFEMPILRVEEPQQSPIDLKLIEGLTDLLKNNKEMFTVRWIGGQEEENRHLISIKDTIRCVYSEFEIKRDGQIIQPLYIYMTKDQRKSLSELIEPYYDRAIEVSLEYKDY